MDDTPKYLISAGDAVSERQRWETEFKEALMVLLAEERPEALVAAAWPGWARAARKFVGRVAKVPVEFVNRLLLADPDSDLSNEEIADRIAPTLATAAYNDHVLGELAARGIPHKAWVTRHDPKVRQTHREADGQVKRLSQPFIVGGQAMQYPADSKTASIENWINDRCVIVGRF